MTVNIVQLQSDLINMGSVLSGMDSAVASGNQATQLTYAGNVAASVGAVTADIVGLAGAGGVIGKIAQATPLAGIATTAASLANDVIAAKAEASQSPTGQVSVKTMNAVTTDMLNLAAQGILFFGELAGLSEVAPEAAAALFGVSVLSTAANTFNSYLSDDAADGNEVLPEIVVNSAQITYSDGDHGAWINHDDGTETFYTFQAGTGNLINSVTVPVGDVVAPSVNGFSFTSQGNTVTVDNAGNITVQTPVGTLSPGVAGTIAITSGTVSSISSDGSSTSYSTDGSNTTQINLEAGSGVYNDTIDIDPNNSDFGTQTDVFNVGGSLLSSSTSVGAVNYQNNNRLCSQRPCVVI